MDDDLWGVFTFCHRRVAMHLLFIIHFSTESPSDSKSVSIHGGKNY